MTTQDKAKIFDQITSLIGNDALHENKAMKCVGTLKTKQGIKGFKPADVGEVVFELNDRYIIVMETLDSKNSAQVPYYKDTLSAHIEFE